MFVFFFFKLISLWLCWVFIAVCGLPLVVASGVSSLMVNELLIVVASRCGAQALGCVGFSSCGTWALEHRLSSCGTWA